MVSPAPQPRRDTFTPALEAILRFYSPDLAAEQLASWEELRTAFLEGLVEHRRLQRKLVAADALVAVAEDLVEEALEPTSYLHAENNQAVADTRRLILEALRPALEAYTALP